MNLNAHLEEWMARDRMAEARAQAAVQTALRQAGIGSPPLRVSIGLALIGLGRWVAGTTGRRASQPKQVTA